MLSLDGCGSFDDDLVEGGARSAQRIQINEALVQGTSILWATASYGPQSNSKCVPPEDE